MLGAVHTVTNDVPPENILAMVDAAVEFGKYPLRSEFRLKQSLLK
jgi:uroporphyrinogen decarboxylase